MADKPVTREEMYLAYLTGDYTGELPKPITRKEKYLYELCLKGMGGSGTGIKGLADLCLALKGAKYETLEASQAAQRFVEANEGSGSDEPTTPTLTSITVTWSADSADAGTDPKTLITSVKANYSDGTSQTVIGYTVSPNSLVEGSQTVTVSYNGKSATKVITGVATGGGVVAIHNGSAGAFLNKVVYSDDGNTTYAGVMVNSNTSKCVISDNVFSNDTRVRITLSPTGQYFACGAIGCIVSSNYDGISTPIHYATDWLTDKIWVKDNAQKTVEYTVKSGYRLVLFGYAAPFDVAQISVEVV